MFPLEFPLALLRRKRGRVRLCDPFCGRGTSIFAARLRGFESYGIDASPVAIAIAKAKLARTSKESVMRLARNILAEPEPAGIPQGEFWNRAYEPQVLTDIVRLREGLARIRETDTSVLLCAVVLGALHGPRSKHLKDAAYFSNQMPRTFASKPDYSARYWRKHRLTPPKVGVLRVIERRLDRVLQAPLPAVGRPACVLLGDSRRFSAFGRVPGEINVVITSPPYYGMRTYLQDQWLRLWFLGGAPQVDYCDTSHFDHSSPEEFAEALAKVWANIGVLCAPDIIMVIRFGAIGSRAADADDIVRASLAHSSFPWKVTRTRNAGTAGDGKRQADQMKRGETPPVERDYFVTLR
jgi:hypothetical protein